MSYNTTECHVCGMPTNITCADCRVNLGARVYVCADKGCMAEHEKKCYGTGGRPKTANEKLDELNPDHPVTAELRQQWYKLLAVVMHKLDRRAIAITSEDITAMTNEFEAAGGPAIIAHSRNDGIFLHLVSMREGEKIAKEHK